MGIVPWEDGLKDKSSQEGRELLKGHSNGSPKRNCFNTIIRGNHASIIETGKKRQASGHGPFKARTFWANRGLRSEKETGWGLGKHSSELQQCKSHWLGEAEQVT